jgi:hypothetical protein
MAFYLKIGHFMLDGASNNNTMLVHLQRLLTACKVMTQFHPADNQVQCYAHTIDLACKAVVAKWPHDADLQGYDESKACNPIALASEVV